MNIIQYNSIHNVHSKVWCDKQWIGNGSQRGTQKKEGNIVAKSMENTRRDSLIVEKNKKAGKSMSDTSNRGTDGRRRDTKDSRINKRHRQKTSREYKKKSLR